MRGGAGLIALGVLVGGAGFVAVDSLREPEHQTREGVFSFRGPYYASCREAFQDGRTNIRRGEPGYRLQLDADNDGLACEPYGLGRIDIHVAHCIAQARCMKPRKREARLSYRVAKRRLCLSRLMQRST